MSRSYLVEQWRSLKFSVERVFYMALLYKLAMKNQKTVKHKAINVCLIYKLILEKETYIILSCSVVYPFSSCKSNEDSDFATHIFAFIMIFA